MSITMPETIAYGKVVGRFIQAVGDTADVDLLPDVVPIQGNITFTPATPLSKEVSVAPPTTVVRSTITCSLNSQGLLTSPAGDVGVWLVAGVYKVAYSTQGAAISPHDIVVSPLHTSENALDLTLALPPGGPVLTASQYAELTARMDTLEAEVVYGASAYNLAVAHGYSGTLEQWLESLHGTDGQDSTVPGPSAYQIAVAEGFTGTPAEWLASLNGTDGQDSTVPGPPGLSAYQIAVSQGFSGTEAEWLASLEGTDGLGVPLGGTTGQALLKASDLENDTLWGEIDSAPKQVRIAYYGSAYGVGWAFYQQGWPDNSGLAGSHSGNTSAGTLTSVAAENATCGWGWPFLTFLVDAKWYVRFKINNIASTRFWIGSFMGGLDADLPYSPGYNTRDGIGLRGSSFDGDTTFTFYADTNLHDTGVAIDTEWHEFMMARVSPNYFECSLDGSAPVTLLSLRNDGRLNVWSNTKTTTPASVSLSLALVIENPMKRMENYA